MSQSVASSLEEIVFELTPAKPVASAPSCCDRAVAQALEATEARGSTAVVAMLVVGVTTLVVGFVAGLTTAWMLTG